MARQGRTTRNSIKSENTNHNDDEMAGVELSNDSLRQSVDAFPNAEDFGPSSPGTVQGIDDDIRSRQLSIPAIVVSRENDNAKAMGRCVAVVAAAIEQLRVLGVTHEYGVPELCAIGDQSSGKSSVISALAGISLPSGTGTCTRVPVYIRTKNNPAPGARWTCTISIERSHDHSNASLPHNFSGENMGPWWPKDMPDIVQFMEITDKGDLDVAMKAAQMAILNPQNCPTDYVPDVGSRWGLKKKPLEEFSPNSIILDISDAGLQTLAFIDLPGVVQNAEKDEMVDMNQMLVKHYIRRNNTLLLCVLSMNVDAANSTAFRFIREAEATNRCIGVLTKPDLIQPTEIQRIWVPLLRGEKHGMKIGHHYYVTKHPGDNRQIAHQVARAEEVQYFDTNDIWQRGPLREFRDRCGMKKLTDDLARKVASYIEEELPNINQKVKNRAAEIDQELEELPKAVEGETLPKILHALQIFSNSILDAMSPGSDFDKEWQNMYDRFRDAVALMKPIIALKDDSDVSIPPPSQTKSTPVINIDSGDDAVVAFSPAHTSLGRTSKFKRQRSPDAIPSPGSKRHAGAGKNGPTHRRVVVYQKPQERVYFPNAKEHAIKFTLRDIKATIRNFTTSYLPGDVDPKAKVDLCKRSVEIWEAPMKTLLSLVSNEVKAVFQKLLDKALGDYIGSDLCMEANTYITNFLDDCIAELTTAIDTLYKTECHFPMTVQEELLAQYKQAHLKIVLPMRQNIRATAFLNRQEHASGKYTYDADRQRALSKISDEKLGADPFEKEVDCLAYVTAVYKIASMRWVENVGQKVRTSMFMEISGRIPLFLERQLGIISDGGEERCRELIGRIDPEAAEKRERLHREKHSLEQAQQHLQNLFNELAADERQQHPDRRRTQAVYSRNDASSLTSHFQNMYGDDGDDNSYNEEGDIDDHSFDDIV